MIWLERIDCPARVRSIIGHNRAVLRRSFPPIRLYVHRFCGVAVGMSAFVERRPGSFSTGTFAHTGSDGDVCLDSAARRCLMQGRDPAEVFWSSSFFFPSPEDCYVRGIRNPLFRAVRGAVFGNHGWLGLCCMTALLGVGVAAFLLLIAGAIGYLISLVMPFS